MSPTPSSSAFVPTLAVGPAARSSFHSNRTSSSTTAPEFSLVPRRTRSPLRMAAETKEKETATTSAFSRLEQNRIAKEESKYRGPQGFTPYAEKVNGRLAQMGFVIGLITEIVSGKPMGEQMLIMFSPLTNLFAALFHTVAS